MQSLFDVDISACNVKVLQTEWDHALRRASGAKVLDDPKRLQKSIDDSFKVKAKRAKKWKDRIAQMSEEKRKREERKMESVKLRAKKRRKRKAMKKAKRHSN